MDISASEINSGALGGGSDAAGEPTTFRQMSPEIEEALGKPKPGAQLSESYIDQPYSGELYGYLRGTPNKYNYVLTPAARKDILRRVSWYLLSKDERLADLVPLDEKTGGAPREELQDELEVPIEYTEVRRGQPCGHVFKRGEGVYRCKSCSMDETCVLCTRCFQGTDHTGHDTSFSVNSGTGGCCDCGDPEAWKIPLRCRHHNTFEELEEVGLEPIVSSAGAPYVPGYNNNECPTSVKRSIELTIAVVLEFILETFATSPISLSAQFDEASIMEDAKNASLAIGDHEQQQKYAVVLWNDEVHSYQDVIDQCTEALQCSQMEAKKIAETVDTRGRDVLRVSASIPELIDIATTMVNVSLSVSIRAARDIFREQLSASLLIWLRDMACCKFRPLARVFQGKVNSEIRSEISYQLCLRWVAPYRNVYLADILDKLYDYNLPESEYGDEYEDDDDEDERENDDIDIEDDAMDEDDHDYSDGLHSKGTTGYYTEEDLSASGSMSYRGAPMQSSSANIPMDAVANEVDESVYARGRRRRRSESEDSLCRQGEERASPRGFIQPQVESGDNDIQPSLWLAESSTNRGESRVPTSIHAAMGAAVDAVGAARTSLARIMHSDMVDNYPAHSMAPGAYPHSAIASESEPEVQMQDATDAGTPDVDSAQDVVISHVLRGCGQQRLDWFLIFDLQLWKEVRSGLRELYMATLMLDSHFKMKIALTFARNYPRLSRAFLTQDRAPEHSVLLYSVQLFTAPTLSSSLVEHHHFLYIILDVLKKFFMQPTPEFLRRYGVILCDTESFRNRRYFHVFHDMRYLVCTPQVQNWVSSKHQFLSAYLSFIGLFQGMNPNCRAVFQHVEFEADTWVNAFNVTLQVAKSCRQLAECYGISARDLFFALRGTLRVLSQSVSMMAEENSSFIIRNSQMQGYLTQNISVGDTSEASQLSFEMHTLPTLWGKQYEVVRYDVSSNPVSFHHPLHWFMAELFQHVKHFSDDRAQEFGFASMQDMVFSAFDTRLDSTLEATADTTTSASLPLFSMSAMDMIPAQRQVLRILDYPIRVCVVMAQIRAGLWVRNGYIIRLQSHHYREVSLRENTYDQDVVLIQFFISIWPDTDHILMTLLDRFGLYDWFSGRPHASRIYEPMHMQYMVEEFLNVLIVLVSERHVATGKNTLDMARREIVHGCLSSISYSELAKKIPERLAENTEFDVLLQQMADFRGPTGIMDFGQYELKDEYLDEVDPYFIHYSRNQREEIEEVLHERLRKRMRKTTNGASDVVDYSPPKLETIRFGPFQRIGMVLHTPLACQVLFYALLHATHTSGDLLSETMVDEALHLIVIALEDGQHGAVAREISMKGSNGGGESESADRGGLWKYALEQGYPAGRGTPMNLLGLVLTLGLKPEMKQWKNKLEYIYQLFRKGGPRIVSCIDDYYANLEATPMGSRVLKSAAEEAKAAERKKQAAKARQAAIMAEFASQQQSFMSQYGDEFAELTDDESLDEHTAADVLPSTGDKGKSVDTQRVHQPLWSAPCGACIVCQEECDGSRPYGSLALIQANRAIRTAPLSDAAHVIDILRLPSELDSSTGDLGADELQSPSDMADEMQRKNAAQARTGDQLRAMNQIAHGAYGATSGLKGFPVMYHQRGMAASTCGHLMHMRCFMQYCQGIEAKRQQQPTRNHPENPHRKEYLCPLCKSLGNVLLPALSDISEYDPLAVADSDPSRFKSQASQAPVEYMAAFERWLLEDWKSFGEALGSASGTKPSVGRDSSSVNSGGGGAATMNDPDTSTGRGEAAEIGVAADVSAVPGLQSYQSDGVRDREHASASAAAAQSSAGSFPFSFTDGLTDSIPRLDDLIRGAQRLPSGLGIHTLLSRFLPQLAGSALGIAPGSERLTIPLSRLVHWLSSRQVADSGTHQHRKHTADSGSHSSTPDIAGSMTGIQAPAEADLRLHEQLEAYQYMYNRLYEVLQNVQRDNHVGLPSPSLFEHLSRSKAKVSAGTLANRTHGSVESQPFGTSANPTRDDGSFIDDEDEDFSRADEHGDAVMRTRTEGHIFDSQPSAFPPFLQNILDHIRVLGANGGPQPTAGQLIGNANNSLPGQLQGAKARPFPFDRAANALVAHTFEVLELSQRGVRNPPVFDHEDSRTLPSGTLSDGVPESFAIFMHSLSKILELQYRSILGPVSDIRRSATNVTEAQVVQTTPAQQLHALIAESHQQLTSSSVLHVPTTASMQGDILARTRLEMLKDLECSLAPLTGSQHVCSRESLCEQSLWLSGSEGTVAKPFLMQDTFAKFSELSHSLVAPFGLDIWHLARLFLTAELIRICVAVGDSLLGEYSSAPKALSIAQSLPFSADDSSFATGAPVPLSLTRSGRAHGSHLPQPWVDAPEARDANLPSVLSSSNDASMLEAASGGIQALVTWTIRELQGPDADADALERLQTAAHPVTVTKLVATLVLPFLRRVALLLNLQYGLDIAREAPWLHAERQQVLGVEGYGTQVIAQSEPECARLLKLLNLPSLHQLFDPAQQPGTLQLVKGWLCELRMFRRRHTSPMSLGAGCTMAVPVAMPTLYSLVDLPDRFEILFERSAKSFCPRCNGIPSDPALCLLCGSFVCAQSFCCEEDGVGECNMHMKTCGGTVGVYLLVKKCGLLLLHHDNGCFMSAPYLDQHGEVDLGLKRGRPLFINSTRYEEMRRLVLTQKIPVFIARKIDQSFDIGGWVSL
ncbi:E3 ubiquitin-protein ligase ubr1 [Coemansia sp. RSA 1365]|nr:E3 ubiquitin-protein ligase ubr1 [Coemansia sp. RSA 1365]